jgi:hypothetical protein
MLFTACTSPCKRYKILFFLDVRWILVGKAIEGLRLKKDEIRQIQIFMKLPDSSSVQSPLPPSLK